MGTKGEVQRGVDHVFYCLAAMSKLGWLKIFMT